MRVSAARRMVASAAPAGVKLSETSFATDSKSPSHGVMS